MPQIPLSKSPSPSPSPTSTQQPGKPIVNQASPSVASKPVVQRLVETFRGTKGLKRNHVIDVIDQTDKGQRYNFFDHCQTCAWEGRYDTLEEATAGARVHVGLDQPAPSPTTDNKTHIRL